MSKTERASDWCQVKLWLDISIYLHPTVQGVTEVEEVRVVAGRHYSKLLGVDLHEGTVRMTDSGSGATLDKVRRWVQGQWQHCSRVIM